LLLSSSIEKPDAPTGDWIKLIAEHFDLATGEYRRVLPAGYDHPRVHIAPPPAALKPVGRSHGPDLLRVLDEAHALAAEGQGVMPPGVRPILVDRTARRQFSFSRLSGQLVIDRPASFTRQAATMPGPESPPDARGLGSLVHDVLARIDFGSQNPPTEIAEWCEHLAPQYVVLNAARAAQLAITMVSRFAASSRARQLATATLHRELEFLLPWGPVDDGRYIRGYIDCLFQSADGAWRVVDYKTNDVRPADVESTIQRYELQLFVYAMAAEKALGTSPQELVLELLRPGTEHVVPWNDAARRRAIKMVDAAIESAIVGQASA
jgi:hypothetical protein